MNKKSKGRQAIPLRRIPRIPRIPRIRKGGQFPTLLQGQQAYSLYQQTQQPQPQQPPHPQQPQQIAQPVAQQQQQGQTGFIGTALTDLKNNKDMFQPVYDTTSSIGLAYNFGIAILATILMSLAIFAGVQINNYYYKYKGKTRGRIVSAKCYTEVDNNKKYKKCDAMIEYEVAGAKYKHNYVSDSLVNVNETADVHYEPSNPNNFTTKYNMMLYIGWGLIVFSIIVILLAWAWFIMSWIFKPIAAVSGIGALGSALTPNS
jgi:hypothetical protein